MSWAAYITNLQTAGFKHAAIYGYSGAAEYAKDAGFPAIDRAVLTKIIAEVKPGPDMPKPLNYMYLMGNDSGQPAGFCVYKQGSNGLIVYYCNTLAIIGLHDANLDSRSAPSIIAKNAGSHLIGAGY
ncbi:MAG: profilin family protein [archaeon]|nr:profilin family protein [archaeon]